METSYSGQYEGLNCDAPPALQLVQSAPGVNQAELHATEMDQTSEEEMDYELIIVHKLWNDFDTVQVGTSRSGHGGGAERLHEKIFRNPDMEDPYKHAAGLRDGAMSALIGIAARKSIESGRPIKISELTSLEQRAKRL